MSYESIKYPTPKKLEGVIPGSKILVIGSGPSTANILKHKPLFKKFFDSVVVLNYSFKFFDDVSDYHLVTEKTSKSSLNKVPVWMHGGNYNKNTPRIINWKGIESYPQDLNLYKTTRSAICNGFNPRSYTNGGKEGLLVGPVSYQNFSLGSSMLCGMHLATILGASEIYLIGADFFFTNEYDHWYKDRAYREPAKGTKAINQHDIVKVTHNGKVHETTAYFKESAEYINTMIGTTFKEISVFDFSNGLLTKAKQLSLEYLK